MKKISNDGLIFLFMAVIISLLSFNTLFLKFEFNPLNSKEFIKTTPIKVVTYLNPNCKDTKTFYIKENGISYQIKFKHLKIINNSWYFYDCEYKLMLSIELEEKERMIQTSYNQ